MVKRVSRRRDLIADTLHSLLPLIPTPWSAEEFIHQVSRSRQRPIHLQTYPCPPAIPPVSGSPPRPPTTSSFRTALRVPAATRSSAMSWRTSCSSTIRNRRPSSTDSLLSPLTRHPILSRGSCHVTATRRASNRRPKRSPLG